MIVLSGNGRGFCSGYDLELFAQSSGPVPGSQVRGQYNLMLIVDRQSANIIIILFTENALGSPH